MKYNQHQEKHSNCFKFFTNPSRVSKFFFLGNKKEKSLAAQIFFFSFIFIPRVPHKERLASSVPVAQTRAKPQVNC